MNGFDGEFEFDSETVEGGEHQGAVGDGRIEDSTLRNVDLSEASWGH